jgi:hypothetical protein
MSSGTLFRLSGLAVVVGAMLAAVAYALGEVTGTDHTHPLVATEGLLNIVGVLFILIGLPALYAWQAHRAGRLGLVGFFMSFFGLGMLEVGTGPISTFVAPTLAERPETQAIVAQGDLMGTSTAATVYFLVAMAGANLGLLLFGVATFIAGVFPRWASGLLIISGPAVFVLDAVVPFGEAIAIGMGMFGLAACGAVLARGTSSPGRPVEVAAQAS